MDREREERRANLLAEKERKKEFKSSSGRRLSHTKEFCYSRSDRRHSKRANIASFTLLEYHHPVSPLKITPAESIILSSLAPTYFRHILDAHIDQ